MDEREIKVLLIEDSRGFARLVQKILAEAKGCRFDLEWAEQLSAGLEQLSAEGADVVLLDLTLPDSTGLESLALTLSRAPKVPIVVLSGHDDEMLAVEAVHQGAQDYLVKGRIDGHSLGRSLQYAIERKRVEEALQRAHDELERRVKERTAELSESNALLRHEITERRQAEEALRESKDRLEEALAQLQTTQQQVLQQERLRALGEMASGIAHDFNNALSPILGFSDLLLDRPERLDDKATVTRHLKTINMAGRDAAAVVRRLREFYRPREEDEILGPVSLNSLAEQAIMLTHPRWKDQALARGRTIRVGTELQQVPPITGNDPEIREILTNLIFNAVDAMPEGGAVTLRTRPDGDHVVLEVSDTGTGMPAEVRQRCLEPFFSTKGAQGTGLGLAMVYGIVQRHQGTLAIESEPGQGTTVCIRLPAHTKQETESSRKKAETPSRWLHVLVVEDEPLVRELVIEYLTSDGHAVETATNGREGLEKFLAGWFDVVVTDLGMPEMGGDQLAATIKRVAPNKPIILLTGFDDLMQASDEPPAGVDCILGKPVTLTALRQALAKVTAK